MQRFIRSNDFAGIVAIWQACFGDDESYVRFFWDNCFPMCKGLGREEDGKLAAMLFMLPGGLIAPREPPHPCGAPLLGGELAGAEYIYAVATLPAYQKRGYAAQLTQWAAEIAKSEGKAALCLSPATQALFAYYSKLGFVQAFVKQNTGHGKFTWPPHMLNYLEKEASLVGRAPMESDEPNGMLLALDERATNWLAQTQGKAYLEYNLE